MSVDVQNVPIPENECDDRYESCRVFLGLEDRLKFIIFKTQFRTRALSNVSKVVDIHMPSE